MTTLRIDSEIGRLRTVLVHEPGREIDRMVPSMMQDLLFDDILFGARAREEHRRFRQVLKFVADEVLEARDLLEEVLQDAHARNAVLTELAGLLSWPPAVLVALNDLPADRLAAGLVEGVETPRPEISDSLDSLYLLPPLPNWFFQRDPAVVLGDRVIRSAMATRARWREPLLSGAIFAFHPRFGRRSDTFWFQEFAAEERSLSLARMRPTLEGGDVLVLSAETLVIGYSERTEKITIERLAEALRKGGSAVRRILVVAIPPQRSTCTSTRSSRCLNRDECLIYGPAILPGGSRRSTSTSSTSAAARSPTPPRTSLLGRAQAAGLDLEPILLRRPDARSTSSASSGPTAPTPSPSRPASCSCYERNVRTAERARAAGYEIVYDDDLLLGRETLERKTNRASTRSHVGPRAVPRPRRAALHDHAARARPAVRMRWTRGKLGTLRGAPAAVDFDARHVGGPHIEAHHERGDRAAREIEYPCYVGRDIYLDYGALLRLASDGALREADAGRACYALYRAKQRQESGQVIGCHIEHRPAADLIEELRIGVPGLRAVPQHERCGCDRLSYFARVNECAASLQSASHEGIGRATDEQVAAFRFKQHQPSILQVDRQRFLVVDRFPGDESSQGDGGIGGGDGEIDHKLDPGSARICSTVSACGC